MYVISCESGKGLSNMLYVLLFSRRNSPVQYIIYYTYIDFYIIMSHPLIVNYSVIVIFFPFWLLGVWDVHFVPRVDNICSFDNA